MSIKKKLLSGAVTLAMLGTMVLPAYAKEFPDTADHWAKDAISRWSDYGVINGDDQGNFRPGEPITRAETATVLNNLISYQKRSSKSFSDVFESDWFEDAVSKLNYANVMTGYEDGTIRPRNNITRQEAAVMIARATGLDTDEADTSALDAFNDSDLIQSWAVDTVALMTSRGYLQGSDGAFRPTDSITRAEVVTIINNIVGVYANGSQISYTGNYGNKLAIIKSAATFKGVTLGGAVICPTVTGSVVFNYASQIDGCLYDLSQSASVNTSDATIKSSVAPYKSSQGTGGNYNYSGGYGSSSSSSSSSSTLLSTYTIKYDANGGKFDNSTVYTVLCKNGTLYSSEMPSEPTREGYIFIDWYTTEMGANTLDEFYKLDSTSKVTANKTLYAGWKIDKTIFGSIEPASGTVNGKKVSELMDIDFAIKNNISYEAGGTLYYVTDFDFPMIDPQGNFIALKYTLPSDIKNIEAAELTITFGTDTYTYSDFTPENLTYTHVFYVSEALLDETITYIITTAESDKTHANLTVDISKLTLTGYQSVTSEAEFKAALADSGVTAVNIENSIELADGTTYTSNTQKTVTVNAPLTLPADSSIIIKGLTFNTGKSKSVFGLITDNGAKEFTFEGNTVCGAFADLIAAENGSITIKDNVFENTYTNDGGFAGADMSEQNCLITGTTGNYSVTGNTFKGYTAAIVYNCASDKITLTKNLFIENDMDIEIAGNTITSVREEMPNIAYNYYDDKPAVSGGTYISAPVYTDTSCTELSTNTHDAWIIAKTNDNTSLYILSETDFLPFETGKTAAITVVPNDARNTLVSITGGTVEDNTTVVSEAASTLSISVENAAAKELVVGHTSTDISVYVADSKESLETTEAITSANGDFRFDASGLAAGSKLYVKVVPADETQKIASLAITDGESFTLDSNGIAEITVAEASLVFNINTIVDTDGMFISYTVTITK